MSKPYNLKMKKPLYKKIKAAISQKLSDKQAASGHTPQAVRDWYKSQGFSAERFYWDLLHSSTPGIRLYNEQPGLKDRHITSALQRIAQEIGVAY